ncbi:MAG TPA: bifunctional UDP-sugar hydrolase/5'-nucleotidase [Bacillota bacterium]|nr:bifunctional UDP-sugar hydrolase/5'-nucleotidase [Bacillota bacterium]
MPVKVMELGKYLAGAPVRRFLAATFSVLLLALPASAVSQEISQSKELYFTVLHTNDIHSHIHRFPLLAGAVNEIGSNKAKSGEPVILTDGGDFISPTIYSWLNFLGFAPELDIMQQIGYDVITLGNHEFDPGHRGLAQILKNAGYPGEKNKTVVISTNTLPPENHPLAEPRLFEKTCLKKLDNGLTIGFLGVLGRSTLPPFIFKHGPIKFNDPHEAAREAVTQLRAQGADVIIAVNHASARDNIELAREVPGIDLILGGHDHERMEPLWVNHTIVLQTSAYLQHLCILELAFDCSSGKLRLRNKETGLPYHLELDKSITEDPLIAEMVAGYEQELNRGINALTGGKVKSMDEVVAYADFELYSAPFQETPMGNFATDALRIVAGQKLGERVDFALLPSGLCWKSLGPGKITFKELADITLTGTGSDMLPGHPVVSFYLTGEEVRRILEIFFLLPEFRGYAEYPQISGLRLAYDPQRAVLFNLPFKIIDVFGDSTPIPSLRSVINAERFTGEGRQTLNDDFVPLARGDQKLYRVATESYVLYHLPTLEKITHILPMLKIVPKDASGNPVPYLDHEGNISEEILVYDEEGSELKVWMALVEYAAAHPPGPEGIPQIPPYYREPANRISSRRTFPLLAWPGLILVGIAALIFGLRLRRRKIARGVWPGQ